MGILKATYTLYVYCSMAVLKIKFHAIFHANYRTVKTFSEEKLW